MAIWEIKPGCFLWPTADDTGGGFNGAADGALEGPLETGRFGSPPNSFQSGGKIPENCDGNPSLKSHRDALEYVWGLHWIVNCVTYPIPQLGNELQSFSTPSASRFQGDRYKGVGVCDGGVLHPLCFSCAFSGFPCIDRRMGEMRHGVGVGHCHIPF